MNPTIPHELNPLPEPIEKQLQTLQARHARHQRMLEEHKDRKYRAREAHAKRRWFRKPIPINMV
jgi:hypothetical protein